MKRSLPLRGDHNLLGVTLCEQVGSEGVASSVCGPVGGAPQRRSSPTRRLRFEDETEMEAESRYLERQWRRAGPRGPNVLVSKPQLNLSINSNVEVVLRGAGHGDKQRIRRTMVEGRGPTCGTTLQPHPPVTDDRGWSLTRHRLSLRTEPIRETYIGSVTPVETRVGRGGAGHVTYMQVRRTANQGGINGTQVTPPQAILTPDLPINPYTAHSMTTAIIPQIAPPTSKSLHSSPSSHVTSSVMSESEGKNGGRADRYSNQTRTTEEHTELQEKSCSSSPKTPDPRTLPTSGCSDIQRRQPMGAAPPDDALLPEGLSRDQPARLSLRRLFSSVRLSRTRTGSLDRLSSRPKPFTGDSAPSGSTKSSNLLRRSSSVQSLNTGAPVFPIKKSSSVQSFVSEQQQQKKKRDRSEDYRPTIDQSQVPVCLKAEDIGCPRGVRPLGRLLQVCADGTILLELNRPEAQTFGFIISRGRGRPDSGVYVEGVVDGATQKLYSGLLSVGDEILEVDGEKVSGFSLDQVSQRLIQSPSTSVRVLRHHRTNPP